QHSLHGAP
nr:immunoglobulin heavy chain junction region [Mus musculus]